MGKLFKIKIIVTLLGVFLISGLFASSKEENSTSEQKSDEVFQINHVAKIQIVMKDSDWRQLLDNAFEKPYVRADFWFDGQLCENVAVRTKGESSLAFAQENGRLPLKVDFNFFNFAQTFHGLKKINLNNGYSDPSFMREVLGYELFRKMGIPTPRASFADVWVNQTHLGLYTMVEQVDKSFLREHFTNANGNLYKPDAPAGNLNWTKADIGIQGNNHFGTKIQTNLDVRIGGAKLGELVEVFDREKNGASKPVSGSTNNTITEQSESVSNEDLLEQMSLKTNENAYDNSSLFDFLNLLNNSTAESFPSKIEKVLNVDQVLRYLAVSVLIVHLDNYIGSGENYYLYEENGKFSLIPWDLNEAFGSFRAETGVNNVAFDINMNLTAMQNKPLVARLLSYEPYREEYYQYLEQLFEEEFSEEVLEKRITELAGLIRPYIEYDELKQFSITEFERSVAQRKVTETMGIPGTTNVPALRAFIAERRDFVQWQLNEINSALSEKGQKEITSAGAE